MLAVGLVVFALVSMSPIDPVQANVGQAAYVNMSEAKRAQLASYWGGDVPFWERFANWAGALLQGDMGTSLRFNAPVSEVIAHRAANSLALMGIAWLLSGALGFALGVAAGRSPRRCARSGGSQLLLSFGFDPHVLARLAHLDGVRRAARLVPHRVLRAHRRVGGGRDVGRCRASLGASCAHTLGDGRGQHRAPYAREGG